LYKKPPDLSGGVITNAFFDDNGYLTKKQEKALKKFYENAVRSRK